jgi:hypothetical protein
MATILAQLGGSSYVPIVYERLAVVGEGNKTNSKFNTHPVILSLGVRNS